MKIGKVYKVINSENGKTYIGSTYKLLSTRLSNHKSRCKNRVRPNELLYILMEDIGIDKFSIIELEEAEVKDKKELLELEKKHIDKFKQDHPDQCLNKIAPINSVEEKKIKKHLRYLKNKDKQYKKQRERLTRTPEVIEKNKRYMREYHNKNREKIGAKNKLRIDCDCGATYTYGNRLRHYNSKRHNKLQIVV